MFGVRSKEIVMSIGVSVVRTESGVRTEECLESEKSQESGVRGVRSQERVNSQECLESGVASVNRSQKNRSRSQRTTDSF